MNDVTFIKQEEPNECGVAALTSIASYYLRRKVDYGEINPKGNYPDVFRVFLAFGVKMLYLCSKLFD